MVLLFDRCEDLLPPEGQRERSTRHPGRVLTAAFIVKSPWGGCFKFWTGHKQQRNCATGNWCEVLQPY